MRMACLLMLVLGSGTVGAQAQSTSRNIAPNVSEQYLFAAANQERASRGLTPLSLDPYLGLAARQHASAMVEHRTISHQFAGEPDVAIRAGTAGASFSTVSENVAEARDSALIHELWMNSPGHRANLLDPQADAIGIAVLEDHGQLYAVEDFAKSVRRVPIAAQEEKVIGLIRSAGVALAATSAAARSTCSAASGYAGERQPSFSMRYTTTDLQRLPDQLSVRLQSGKFHQAEVGACTRDDASPFTRYSFAVLLYP